MAYSFANSDNNKISIKNDSEELGQFEINEIEVLDYVSMLDNNKGKPKILYKIKYNLGNSIIETTRSYSEFLLLFRQLKKMFKKVIFPLFPAKRPHCCFEKEIIYERVQAFDNLLKFIIKKKFITNNLILFLKQNSEIPKITKKNCNDNARNSSQDDHYKFGKSRKNKKNSLDCHAGTANSEDISNYDKSYQSKNSDNELEFDEDLKSDPENSRSNIPFDQSFSFTELEKSKVSELEENKNKNFIIDVIIDDFYKNEDEIIYFINIIYKNNQSRKIQKSYKDFKILYEELKKFICKNNEKLEELPNKGNINFFSKDSENKVITYRKFALRVYLKYLLSHQTFQSTDVVKNFLQ